MAAWPADLPLACLCSGDPADQPPGPWARWTILATPTDTITARTPRDALAPIDTVLAQHAPAPPPADHPPFAGGLIGSLSYDLGLALEPASSAAPPTGPLATWLVCPGAYAHDALTGRWWVVGDEAALPRLDRLDSPHPAPPPEPYRCDPLVSDTGRSAYCDRVARTIALIRAGDIYQANIAHRLSAPFTGSTRSAFVDLARAASPWFGAYIESPARSADRTTTLSLSPELFLDYDAHSRTITTRPMKGTLPAHDDPATLAHSAKDAAELAMIVDLMRNDLGRVASLGSVRVDQPRVIERHAPGPSGVYQGVATVSARLRDGLSARDLLAATMPGGSITGAPKVRAMQIIDGLESSPRGPAFGCVGYASTTGHLALNIAIRTAIIRGSGPPDRPGRIDAGTLQYAVGAGIVADSDPASEWCETLAKARVLDAVAPREPSVPSQPVTAQR